VTVRISACATIAAIFCVRIRRRASGSTTSRPSVFSSSCPAIAAAP